MTAKGHVLLATSLAYVPFVYVAHTYSFVEAVFSLIVVVFGSLLPDVDEPHSYIGNKSMYISNFLKILGLKHRTLTHWLITPLIIFSFGFAFDTAIFSLGFFALGFGILAHDIGDMLTKGGIVGFLFPFYPEARIALLPDSLRFATFSLVELLFNLGLLILNLILYYGFLSGLV